MSISLSRRGFVRLSSGITAGLAAGPAMRPARADQPKRGGLIKTVDMNYSNMDPTAKVDPESYIRLIYDSLIDVTMDLEYRPGLAETLPEQVGDRSYVFKLRKGVTFHDGNQFDAAAVKYNVDRVMAGETITPITGLWNEWLDKLTVIDPATVRFDLKRPWPDFYWSMADTLFFGSPALLKSAGRDYGTRPDMTAGTGPFIMTSFAPRQKIELKRNPNYYRQGEPYVDGVVGTFIASGSVRLLGLRRGDLTNCYTFPESQLPLLNGANNVVLHEGEASTLTVMAVNTKHPALRDKRVRQAIQHAVDGQQIIDQVYRGQGRLIDSIFPPWHRAYTPAGNLAPIRPDLDRAKALLAESGYGPDRPLSVPIESFNAPAHVERAVLLQSQLKRVGINVEVRSIPSGQAITNLQSGNYVLSLWQMNGGPSLIDYSWDLFSGKSGKNDSFYNKPDGFQNPGIEPMLDSLTNAFEPEKIKGTIARIQDVVFDDVPYIYLNWRNHRDAWLISEKGFQTSKLKNRQDFRTVWFES